MPKIFISYRRVDSQAMASLIYRSLAKEYGEKNVFLDTKAITSGQWWQQIQDALDRSNVVVVVIGPKWESEIQRRLDHPDDFVREEVKIAISKNKAILLAFVDGIKGVDPALLPDDIKELPSYQGYEILHEPFFDDSIQHVVNHIPHDANRVSISRMFVMAFALVIIGITVLMLGSALMTNVPTPETDRIIDAQTPTPTEGEPTTGAQAVASTATTLALLLNPTPTNTPNIALEQTATALSLLLNPTPMNTPNVAEGAQTLVANQTAQQIINNFTLTAAQQANQTATATVWTKTPTPDLTASVVALLTEWADGTLTQQALDLTETATLWTATPTSTLTHTPTPIPSEDLAKTPVTANADWTPYEKEFDGVTMVLVPVGCFIMGSDNGGSDEQSVHEQCFSELFWIDKYEVTNEQYGSIGCSDTSSQSNQPRNCITWFDAKAFCEGRGGRLPTEKEWEYAARGPDNLVYPWGNDWNESYAVWDGNSDDQVAIVNSRSSESASWVGARDMSGNVSEWVNSLYTTNYPYNVTQEDASDTVNRRMLRGGSWLKDDKFFMRSSYRSNKFSPTYKYRSHGFRCARS